MNIDALLAECDCAIVTSPASLYYLSGFDQSDAVIVLNKNECVYVTNPLYEVAVKGAVRKEFNVKILSRADQYEYLRSCIQKATRVGVEYEHLTLSAHRVLFGVAKKETVDLSPLLAKMRLLKRPEELEIIKYAEGIVDTVFSEVVSLLKVGVTEREIRDQIDLRMSRYGASGPAFDTIVAFGENAAMPHAIPSDRRLKVGDCVLMDFGAKYKGYCSDFTRTVCFGEPGEKFRRAYATVLRAQKSAIEYLQQGGRSAAEADSAARKIIDDSEFKGCFNHTLGHGVGIEIHELPSLSQRSQFLLSDGMVFTLEPGIYVEGEFGIRIESLVALENGKLTVIDRTDKEIYIV